MPSLEYPSNINGSLERYPGKLKFYVRNKAQAEGSIAKGYMVEEALTFYTRYLDAIEIVFN